MKKVLSIILLIVTWFSIVIVSIHVEAKTDMINNYYYSQLNDKSKKIYQAIDDMKKQNILKSGNGYYDLIANNILTENEVKKYELNNEQILKDFGAARDAFYLDNPDIFYVDFNKLSISFYRHGQKYLARIDSGREASFYNDEITNEEQINELENQLEKSINNYLSNLDNLEKEAIIKEINNRLINNVEYSFEANGIAIQKANIRTVLGGLVYKYAVCEGYSRAFKLLMDAINIQTVQVIGYVLNSEGIEPHSWNYVQLNNKWYLVDPTFNDSNNNKYLLIGKNEATIYKESNIISNSGFEFKYPSLATYNYGTEEIKTTITYDKNSEPYSQTVKYEYLNYPSAKAMQENNLYLVARHEYFNNDDSYVGWTNCYALYLYEGNKNEITFNQNVLSTEFLVTTQVPNEQGLYQALDEDLIVAKSDIIYNDIYNESSNNPKVLEITPSPTTVLEVDKTYDVSIKYNLNIKKIDETKEINVYVYNEKSSNLNDYIKINNVRIVNNNTITFTLTPSKMYEHDNLSYKFIPINIVGINNQPLQYGNLVFARPWVVCSKVFNDQRLYIDAIASPTLIDNSDLSMNGFLDNNGNQISQNQRSQLVLVTSKPSTQDDKKMNEMVKEINENEILESSTYELDLHVCGGVTKIPEGSYVKVAFGFPEGYSAKDKGVTFKVYHFKKDVLGNIDPSLTEEIDCVVTEYGIIVVVSDFSPFMVVAVKETTDYKNIYVTSSSTHGKIQGTIYANDSTSKINSISKITKDSKVVYQIIPDDGYTVDYVTLNGNIIKVEDNCIELSYNDIEKDNELIIHYLADDVKEKNSKEGLVFINARSETTFNIMPIAIIIICVIVIMLVIFIIVKKTKKSKN